MTYAQRYLRAIPRPIRALVPPLLRRAVKSLLMPNRMRPATPASGAGVAPDVAKAAAEIRWFHTIDLGHGLVTPGVDDSFDKLRRIRLPESLAGRSVLDIGALDGFFSFEAEARGASKVTALDSVIWDQKPSKNTYGKAGFELARKTLRSKVKDLHLEVMGIAPETAGVHDVVLFLGVFYHLEDPILALKKIASVTRKLLILETEAAFTLLNRAEMFFYPGEYNREPSNWWVPTPAAVRDLLKTVGFKRVELVDRYTANWIPWTGRAAFHAYK